MKHRNIKLYYLLETVSALALGSIIPAYVLFFRQNGVTLFEVAVLAAVFEATVLVFEIPTGKFADRYGRKLSVAFGFLLFLFSGVIFLSCKSFYGFLAAEIMFGLAETFISGALEALAVDSIEETDRETLLSKLFGNRTICRSGGFLFGMIWGGYLAGIALDWLFLPLTILFGLAFVISILLKEMKNREEGENRKRAELFGLWRTIFNNRAVMALFAVGLLANFAFEPADQYWQVLFDEIRLLDPYWFGLLTGAGLVLAAVLARAGERFYKYPKAILSLLFIVVAGGFYASAELSMPYAVAGIIMFFTIKSLIQPIISTNLNIHFESAGRAASLSGYNLTCSIGEVAAGLLAGVLVGAIGVGNLFLWAGVAALMIPIVYYLLTLKPK